MLSEFNFWLAGAGLLTFLTFVLHTFVATKRVATPLLDTGSALSSKSRFTNYYCWHAISFVLLLQTGCFFWSARIGNNPDLGYAATIMALGFLVWNVGMNIWLRPKTSAAPQWIFWLPISGLAITWIFTR